MTEPVGIVYSIAGQSAVESSLNRLQSKARQTQDVANRAETTINRVSRRLIRRVGIQIGRQAVAFAAGEVLGDLVQESTQNRISGYVTQGLVSIGTGFAYGGPVGAAGAAVFTGISALVSELRAVSREQERLEKKIADQAEDFSRKQEDNFKREQERRLEFEDRLREIERTISPKVEDIVWESYFYAGGVEP